MNVKVNLNYPIYDGAEIVFKAPCDASEVTGLIVYYPSGTEVVSSVFTFADAHANDLGDIDELFAKGAVVKVILDTDTKMAFVQNAVTNAYLEERFAGIGGGSGVWVDSGNPNEIEKYLLSGEIGQMYMDSASGKSYKRICDVADREDYAVSWMCMDVTINGYAPDENGNFICGLGVVFRQTIDEENNKDFLTASRPIIEILDAFEKNSLFLQISYKDGTSVSGSLEVIHLGYGQPEIYLTADGRRYHYMYSDARWLPERSKTYAEQLGDVSEALDVLHSYAETLKGGDAV